MIYVINVRKMSPDVYIGRRWSLFDGSIFHNPYHIGTDGTREEVLEKFIVYWYADEQKWLRDAALRDIPDGSTLGCWCAPQTCHGDIIAGYLMWKRS